MAITSLKEKLEVRAKPLYQVIEGHEKELQVLNDLYSKVNSDALNDVNQTKVALMELRERYNSLIMTMAQQEESRKEVRQLADTQKNADTKKVDIRKSILDTENVGHGSGSSNLEKDETKHEIERQALRSQLEAETHELKSKLEMKATAYEVEELKLKSSIKQLTKERHDQQYQNKKLAKDLQDKESRMTELAKEVQDKECRNIELTKEVENCKDRRTTELCKTNADLVEVSKIKDTKITKLQEYARILEGMLVQKSKEASKFAKDARDARRAVSSNRKQCKKLRYQLEKCKQDLSRYVVEDMTLGSSSQDKACLK